MHNLKYKDITGKIITAYKLEVGLRINFGEKSLKFKRFVKSVRIADSRGLKDYAD